MGCMRFSKSEDGLNFHFLMMVQMTATPPMAAAMTMRTVTVVCFVLSAGAGAEVEDAATPVLVAKTSVGISLPSEVGRFRAVGLAVGVWAALVTAVGDDEVVVVGDDDAEVVGEVLALCMRR
jgi:hypothetical protein